MLYKNNSAAVIGILEMACGIGLVISPILGSFLYNIGGFNLPFICFGAVNLFFAIFLKCIISSAVDIKNESVEKI